MIFRMIFYTIYSQPILGAIAHNVSAVSKPLRGIKGFGGPDKEMRSISRADKLCRRFRVGMERNRMTQALRRPSRYCGEA
jgi:hypothetical protein